MYNIWRSEFDSKTKRVKTKRRTKKVYAIDSKYRANDPSSSYDRMGRHETDN